jgi:hypothetical protein
MKAVPHSRLVVLPQVRTLLGIFCASMVLLLTVLSASPAAHEQICHHDSTDHEVEGGCAVDLFAHGVEPMLAPVVLASPVWLEREQVVATTDSRPNAPRLFLPYACGPPLV